MPLYSLVMNVPHCECQGEMGEKLQDALVPQNTSTYRPLGVGTLKAVGDHPAQVRDAADLHPSAPTPGSMAPITPCFWGFKAAAKPEYGSKSSTGQASTGILGNEAACGVLGRSILHGSSVRQCLQQQ